MNEKKIKKEPADDIAIHLKFLKNSPLLLHIDKRGKEEYMDRPTYLRSLIVADMRKKR